MATIILIVIYISFISLGLPDSLLGSAWPVIRKELSVPLPYAGFISMIISCGTIVSSLLSGKLLKKFGTGKLTLISVFMTACALLGFSLSANYIWFCLLAIPLGLGAGAVDAALNNFIALHYSAKHMSWLHCFWGIGATVGPIIMSFAISEYASWQKGYLTVSIIQFTLVFILFLSLPLWKKDDKSVSENEIIQESSGSIFHIPGIRPAFIGFICYSAVEATAGLWGASFLVHTKGIDTVMAARFVSMFYLGITVGRFINGFITKKLSNPILIRVGQITIGIGALLLIIFDQSSINLVGLILLGMGCAPIYPSMLHETPVRFGKNNSSRLMGIQMGFAYMGATFFPPVFGFIMGQAGLWLYPILILIMLIIMTLGSERINTVVNKQKSNYVS